MMRGVCLSLSFSLMFSRETLYFARFLCLFQRGISCGSARFESRMGVQESLVVLVSFIWFSWEGWVNFSEWVQRWWKIHQGIGLDDSCESWWSDSLFFMLRFTFPAISVRYNGLLLFAWMVWCRDPQIRMGCCYFFWSSFTCWPLEWIGWSKMKSKMGFFVLDTEYNAAIDRRSRAGAWDTPKRWS